MKCEACDVPMRGGRATPGRPYRYQMSGLDNVFLVGIDTLTCPKCRAIVPIIPKPAQLHTKIAAGLARKPALLTGSESRYLRKHAGVSSREFARLVGVSPEHLSRFEAGRYDGLSEPTDRLVRFLAICVNGGKIGYDLIRELVDAIESNARPSQLRFEHEKRGGWRVAA